MFIGNYGMEADMWAAGMMMYQLLADRFPWCARAALIATWQCSNSTHAQAAATSGHRAVLWSP